MNSTFKVPFYAKASLVFIGLFAFIGTLYIAQHIILPIIYATIIAIVLSPLVDFFIKRKISRVFAITISLAIIFLITILLATFLFSRISLFTDSFPILLDKFSDTINRVAIWASHYFNISVHKINLYLANAKTEILNSGMSSIGLSLSRFGSALVIMVLIPVYVFMILFYQPLLLDFIRRLFGADNRKEVDEVLSSTKRIIQRYLLALLFEAFIIATLNSIGLLIIGIDYAIMLGVIGALVNVIPYVGGIVAVAIPMTVAFVTKSSTTDPLLVLGVYIIIQFIDNHYVIPKVVASKVKINALISIIVVLAGGALWGLPGMFLSIPLTAILKVIFDHIDSLKPWGFLLGDTMPTKPIFKINMKNK
jgi:predicted PurR-regulated permease PerM